MKKVLFVCAVSLFVCTAWYFLVRGGSSSPTSNDITATDKSVRAIDAGIYDICTYNKISLSPSGHFLAVGYNSVEGPIIDAQKLPIRSLNGKEITPIRGGGSIVVTPTSCITADAEGHCWHQTKLSVSDSMSLPVWGHDDDTFFVVARPHGLVEITRKNATMFRYAATHPVASSDETSRAVIDPLYFRGRGAVSAPDTAEDISQRRLGDLWNRVLHGATTRGKFYDSTGYIGTTRLTKEHSIVTKLGKDGREYTLPVSSFLLEPVTVWHSYAQNGKSDYLAFTSSTLFRLTKQDSETASWVPVKTAPFSKPIFESASGAVIGTYTDQIIKPLTLNPTFSSVAADAVRYVMAQDGFSIVDASYSATGKTLVVLISDIFGRKKYAAFRADGRPVSAYTCRNTDSMVYKFTAAPVEHRVSVINVGSAAWPLWSHYYQGKGKRKGIIVYLHGGPGASYNAAKSDQQLGNLLIEGYDVLIPEYSASGGVGFDVMSRLAHHGGVAIDTDMGLVADWIAHTGKQKYPSAVLLAESFGGLFYWSRAVEHNAFQKVILQVPYLIPRKYRDALPPGTDKARIAFNDARYEVLIDEHADKELLHQWIDNRTKRRNTLPRTLAIFAHKDYASRPGDLPRNPNIRVFWSKYEHGYVPQDPRVWDEITAFLHAP